MSLVLVGCGAVPRAPLALPPRDAPIELRAATYRAHTASVHRGLWRSWEVQFGDDLAEVPLRDARARLDHAPRAEEILRERDNQFTLGGALLGAGAALVLGGAIVTPLSVRDDGFSPVVPVSMMVGGLIATTVGALLFGGAEYQVTYATDAYNRWLWDALALPHPRGPMEPLLSTQPLVLGPAVTTAPPVAPTSPAPAGTSQPATPAPSQPAAPWGSTLR